MNSLFRKLLPVLAGMLLFNLARAAGTEIQPDSSAGSCISEIMTIPMDDGLPLEARLSLPGPRVSTLVVVVHGTGPYTYETRRPGFNYYDAVAQGFCDHGVGFFSYSRRGVTPGDNPPYYATLDPIEYGKYTPLQETEDVEAMIRLLKADERFRDTKILLYGISEGTIIAPMVAERALVSVDGLLLHGYAHESMYDIVARQMEGHGVMLIANKVFDKDGDGAISRQEYESEEQEASAYRSYLFADVPFGEIDATGDGIIDVHDLTLLRKPFHEELLSRIGAGDDEWIAANFLPLTSRWFREHFALEANKTRLLRLGLPIHIFHGEEDANVPVATVYDMYERFRASAKENLTIHVFPGHNHDLNIERFIQNGEWPEGYRSLFRTAAEF